MSAELLHQMIEKLTPFQAYGLIAFVVTVFATPLAAAAARRFGVMDLPDAHLKPHARPTPYLGGAAICLGWAAALSAAMAWGHVELRLMLPIMLGGIAISIIGLVDDVREVPPKWRLLIGTVIIAAVLLSSGTGFRLVDSLLRPMARSTDWWGLAAFGLTPAWLDAQPQRTIITILSVVISVFVVLGAVNSTNLIDGLNGLCTGVTGIISLGFFLLAGYLAAFEYSRTGDPVRLVISIAMFGAAMGFLPLNFYGKIFMGDAGSVLLGYTCGIMILLFAEKGIFRWVIGALMIFALPIFDTALAMFRRWRAGRSIFEGDRSHFYDQLVQRGLSVRQTVLVCYLLAIVFTATGLMVMEVRTLWALLAYLGVCSLTTILTFATGLTTPEEPRRAATPDAPAPERDADREKD